jgi:hypothetical protein
MPLDLVPFALGHLDNFEPGIRDRKSFEEPYLSALRGYWVGRAVCAVGDGKVLGIAGISVSDGCAYPWMVLSEAARQFYPIHVTRLARRVLDGLFEIERVDRIEVHVDCDFPVGRLWIERLGFFEQNSTQASMRYVRYGLSRATYRENRDRCGFHNLRGRCAK